jgi:hypothetical protein
MNIQDKEIEIKTSGHLITDSWIPKKFGFMAGQISTPADFDEMGKDYISKLFYEENNQF